MFTHNLNTVAAALVLMTLGTASQAVTREDLQKDGPYPVTSTKLADTPGFGSGTLHIPNSGGPFPLVAVCPGFMGTDIMMQPIGKRLATHGFATITFTPTTVIDFPASRAAQILAVLKAGVSLNDARIDGKRLVASGWSMGGGGTLQAASKVPTLKAAVTFAPWDLVIAPSRSIQVPTIIFGATGDIIAPNGLHSRKFYEAIPDTTKKAMAILKGSGHFFPMLTVKEPVSYNNIAWSKVFAAGDASYAAILDGQDPDWASFDVNGTF